MDLMYIRTRAEGDPDSGYLSGYEADFDISTEAGSATNDFAIKMPLPESPEGLFFAENKVSTIIFVEGTEYGGIILGSSINIEDNTITYTGRTWRGLIMQYIIEPPAGQDYRIVSGNLAESIRTLPMHPIFTVEDTEYAGGSFQFDRYIDVLDGINKLLVAADPDLRFSLKYIQEEGEYDGEVSFEIVKVRDSDGFDYILSARVGVDVDEAFNVVRMCQGES